MKRIVSLAATAVLLIAGASACSSPKPQEEVAAEEVVISEVPVEDESPKEEVVVEEAVADAAPVEEQTDKEDKKDKKKSKNDLSTTDACLSLAGPLQQVSSELSAVLSQSSGDPQAAVDTWRTLANTFEEFSQTVGNAEVAERSAAVGRDAHTFADEAQRTLVDQDFSAMDDFVETSERFVDSYEDLLSLCDTD